MKAFDTTVLLALLEGRPSARTLLRTLRGHEVATTEANLLELTLIAARGPPAVRRARRATLERLRRRITVLPIDPRAVAEVDAYLGRGGPAVAPLALAMMGSLTARGCDELYTFEVPTFAGRWKLKVTQVADKSTK